MVWPELSPLLAAGWEGCIPERLWLLIICRTQFPEVVDSRFLKQHWGSKKILSPKNHAGITELIKVRLRTGCKVDGRAAPTALCLLFRFLFRWDTRLNRCNWHTLSWWLQAWRHESCGIGLIFSYFFVHFILQLFFIFVFKLKMFIRLYRYQCNVPI